MEAMLLEDELDVGIAFDDSRSQEIVVQPLLTETLALVVSRAHPLAGERDLQLQALDAQPLILLSSEFAAREQIDRYCRLHRLETRRADGGQLHRGRSVGYSKHNVSNAAAGGDRRAV